MSNIFVSYSWKQGERVWDRLVPVLRASGIEVLIDRERFVTGKDILGQMDTIQDRRGGTSCVSAPIIRRAPRANTK